MKDTTTGAVGTAFMEEICKICRFSKPTDEPENEPESE